MAPQRQCILCETFHDSKQEMEEHMRSMLHHRELEKLKGRDCGHECRVCKVTVASLTDYASHISSPVHKQNVEAAELKHAGNDREDYFDKALVELIEKRKEQIRKEKEAAAAKLAKEEEDRKRKEEYQQRLQETKARYRRDCGWQQPSRWCGGQQNAWMYHCNAGPGEPRPWHSNQYGKSATWHAQEPPNFQRWESDESMRESFSRNRDYRQWNQSRFPDSQQSRLPWLSSGGSNYGIYGQNNIAQYSSRSANTTGQSRTLPSTTGSFKRSINQFQNTDTDPNQADAGGQAAESDHKNNKGSKAFGSNPKLDKSCRWSPYPVTKGFESNLHKDTNPNPAEKKHKVHKKQEKAPESSALKNPPQSEQKPAAVPSGGPNVKEKEKLRINIQELKSRSGSKGQAVGQQTSSSTSSNQKLHKSSLSKEKKMPSLPSLVSLQLTKVPSPTEASKSTLKPCALSSPSLPPPKSRSHPQLPETVCKARLTAPERRSSLDNPSNKKETSQHSVEKQKQRDWAQNQLGVNKENSCRQNAAKPNVPTSLRPDKPLLLSTESGQFLQSLQVSTSTTESSEVAVSNRNHEESRKKVEVQNCSDEALQAADEENGLEKDVSTDGDAPTNSGSSTSLSKLDIPSVLKRDLTKHMSSKGKTGGREPNLNIARRVRNLSESRRSDSEKESGLKPTVRQLISSSGSRRNVNWEQVYQEVRKKQDKGKGMPRFGIEMVPNELEYQSQEEDDLPLLEGEHWESLADFAGTTRKRSLSESSIALDSSASSSALLTTLPSKEAPERDSFSFEQQGPAVLTLGNKDTQGLDPCESKPQRQKPAAVKALQRSDSVLGDSSSGMEQFDGAGTGKRRRRAGDILSAETSGLEHNSKRRKVKPKQGIAMMTVSQKELKDSCAIDKERCHIDQLLSVSLREEELSQSLQTVDSSLIQARAALEAAYMEVQRLMVAKQQMTVEMNTLRNKRIDLLKGMQGSLEEASPVKVKEEKMDGPPEEVYASCSVMFSSVTDTVAPAPNPSPPAPPAQLASPPSSSLPFSSVVIKEEPQSPVWVSSELDLADNTTHCAHSTTPELPVASAAASPADSAFISEPSPGQNPDLYQTSTEFSWENFEDQADSKESLSGLVEATEKVTQTTTSCLTPMSDVKPSKLLSPRRRSSELGSAGDCAAANFLEPSPVPPLLHVPPSPPDLSGGKRVRKLKKRKELKKAQSAEQPESSDTEIDGGPVKRSWLRQRRRTSGGSQVTTSSLLTEDMSVENSEEAQTQMSATIRAEEADDTASVAAALMENVDSEESMEVCAGGLQPDITDDVVPEITEVQVSDSLKAEPLSPACNEVTSTSDMEICKSSESDLPFPITLPKTARNSSDASSDHGEDEMATEGTFEGHQEAVNAMQIHNGLLFTCSGDRTVRAFDLVSHKCVAVFEGHSSRVSCLLVSAAPSLHHRLFSGSSDQTIRCYSLKTQEFEHQFSLSDRVLCLHSRWKTLYAGLANGTVVTINLKTNRQTDVFECHGPRAVSCLATSQEGARRILLVGSYDNTISVRDAKNGLLLRTLEGHTKTVLCMKVVNDQVFSGSSDQCVYTHNIHSGELVRVFKGHSHGVTVVSVLGKVMVTACLDKLVRVYDLQSQEQLQVYGGHKDMVMCMTVHKNMIYTGCYDGSIQAVKLNLMQNHRCWWHGCSLVFGLTEHLQQHLINDHTSSNFQTLKCRWKNCEEFFSSRNSSRQSLLLHLQKHTEENDLEP